MPICNPAEVPVKITKRYLLFPVARVVRKNGRALKVSLGDKVVRGGTVPYKPIDPDFWTFCDVQEFIGKTVTVNRKVQMGWAQIPMEEMPFSQMMSFPAEVTLRTTPKGIRMFAEPVKEIETLYATSYSKAGVSLNDNSSATLPVKGDLFDINAEFKLGTAKRVGIEIGGVRIEYYVTDKKIEHNIETPRDKEVPLKPEDGTITLRLLVDRSSIEIYGNNGAVVDTEFFPKTKQIDNVTVYAQSGEAKLALLI